MKNIYSLKTGLLILICLLASFGMNAQTTVTINATGLTGSYNTGSVNAGGTKNDGNMITINSTTNRGWAKFDLSTLPAGAVISSVNCIFTTYTSVTSGATNNLYGFVGDPSLIAGATLYTNCASGTSFNASTWTANALNTKVLNATGISFIQSNITSTNLCIGFVRGSTNTYNIYGYPDVPANQPQLQITYTVPPPCAGTPNAGTTVSTANPVCPSVNFTLSLTGATTGVAGLTYQWQSSADGVTYTNIPAATNPSLTTSQTAATYFQCIIVCTNSLAIDTSTALQVNLNSFINCYCTSNATSTADEEILNVTLNTLNNSSTCTSTGGPGSTLNEYSDYTGTVPATVVAQSTAYPFSVGVGTCGGNYGNSMKIFIDFNQNGLFTDAGENVYTSAAATTGPHTESGTISIPVTALTGNTRMRVIVVETGTPASITPCGTYTWGETEDYLVNIVSASACTGTPNGGITQSSANPICSGINFTLSMSTPPSGLTGITYQWQSSPDGITYTNIGGATSVSYSTSQSAATYYQCIIGCTLSGLNDTTTALLENMSSFMSCYCTSNATSTADEEILNVSLNTLNNTSTCTTTGGPGSILNEYSDYTTVVAATTVAQSTSYPFSVQVGTCGGNYGNGVKIFIDYNHNGLFTDAGENVYTSAASTTGPHTESGTISIPGTALTGNTRMRVIVVETGTPSSITPCGTYTWGETEDYLLNIVAATACTGTPNGGNTMSTAASVCPSVNFTLSMSTPPSGMTGITYQWQSSPDGITYSDIGGATAVNYSTSQTAATYYWCIITCTNSGMIDTTTTLLVNLNSFLNCYCTSNATSTADEEILNVTLGTLNNSSTCATTGGPGSILNEYSDYTTVVAAPVVSQTSIYPFTVQVGTCGGNYGNGIKIFMDFNHNGLFTDAGETVFTSPASTTGPHTESGNITIPGTALTGNTRMRVIDVETGTPASITPCGTYTWGETEDYLVNIVNPTPCSGAPTPGNTQSTTTSACSGSAFTLSMSTPPSGLSGITYQWQSSADNITYTDIVGATASTYPASETASTYYQCVVTCSAGPASATTTPLLVNVVNCINMTNGSTTTCAANFFDSGGPSANYLNGENYTYTFNPNPGSFINIAWSSFVSESGFDYVTIYDGPTTASPILYGPLSGTLTIPTFTSSDPSGAITVLFTSDGSVNYAGWAATVSCVSYTPTISSFTPAVACEGSGTSVVITGTNFSSATNVSFNGTSAIYTVNSATQITATLPAAATTGTITVTSPGGTGTSSTSFTVNALPVLTLNDSTQCAGTILLDAGNAGSTYLWSDASTAQTLTASITGTYYVTVTTAAGCIASDTSHIAINPFPVVNLGPDSIQCGGSILLDAGNAGSAYLWNDASTMQTLSVTSNGTYSVTVTTPAGCSASDAVNISIDPLPVVNLGADTAQCIGTITLDAGNPGETFLWSDASTSQTLTVSTSGTYYVTVTNTSSCSATDTIHVAINPLPVVNLGADTVQCAGTVLLDAGNAGFNYVWNDLSTMQTLSAAATGTYSVMVTNPATGCMAGDTINVTIHPLPVVNIGPDSVRCGGSVTMNAGNPGSTYLWSETSVTQTLTVSASGLYYVTVTNTFGCSAADSANITINAIPVVNLGADTSQCGGSITLDAGNPGLNFAWSNLATTQTITMFTTDTVDVTVTNPVTGCMASDTIAVHFGQYPVVNLGADTTQCAGTVILNAANPSSSVLWNTGATTHTISTALSGTFSVTVTTGFGCSSSDTIMVTINPLPAVGFAPFTTPVCLQAAPFTLTGGSPAGGVYAGVAVSGSTYTPMTAGIGTHSIMYTVTNVSTGCSNSSSQNITIQDCTGITENANAQEVNVYPNPTDGMFNISITNANFNELIISIVDIQGKQVYGYDDKNISKDYNKQINLEGIAKGMYYILLNNGTDVKIQKLIIN